METKCIEKLKETKKELGVILNELAEKMNNLHQKALIEKRDYYTEQEENEYCELENKENCIASTINYIDKAIKNLKRGY